MEKINGIWWTTNNNKVVGDLTITDEDKIYLITYEKLYDASTINGFAKGIKITLLDAELDRTDIYYDSDKEEEKVLISEDTEIKYTTYKYIAEVAIFGHNYERKGDIRLNNLKIRYTNLDKWVNWTTKEPKVEKQKNKILLELNEHNEKRAKCDKFDIVIKKPYKLLQGTYNINITNQLIILVENIKNVYIQSVQEIINCLRAFLILCMGDNIKVESIEATDIFDRNIEIILGYEKSNYENRSIFKNIIKYDDIKGNLSKIMKNWLRLYEDNELLIANFINLQTREEPLISEYTNLMTAIDSLYLVMIEKESTKDHYAEIIKKLLKETNFILNLSDYEINGIAIKVKDMRRYFIHSNKTQKEMVNSNISFITGIMNVLIEAIRSMIMIKIGIDKEKIEKYYKNIEELKMVKHDIVNNINEDEEINDERIKEGKKIIKPLSKKDREAIAELNALTGTSYRETAYDLENTKDLIEIVENLTAEYMDYTHYAGQLASIAENFDQSIEVYYPAQWFRMTTEKTTGNSLIDETISNINEAQDNMYDLSSQAEHKCIEIWKILLLGNDKEAKEFFVGDISKYNKKQILKALGEVIENIYDVGYENQVQNDAKNFGRAIKNELENYVE